MKGFMSMTTAIILIILMVAIAFVYFNEIRDRIAKAGPTAIEGPGGVAGGLVLAEALRRKKGIVLTTTMLATIIFVVVVVMVLFLIFAGLEAEAGATGSGFFFGAFDAIMRILPG